MKTKTKEQRETYMAMECDTLFAVHEQLAILQNAMGNLTLVQVKERLAAVRDLIEHRVDGWHAEQDE